MTNVEVLAVAKAVAEKTARGASTGLPVGEHAVDVTVRITGTLTRGADYDQRIVEKADPWALLGAALSRLNGVTVASLVRETLGSDAEGLKRIKAQADAAMAEVKAPTMTRCNGKITTDLEVVAVEMAEREGVAA